MQNANLTGHFLIAMPAMTDPYFAKTLRFESHIEEAFVTRLYRPLNRTILRLSRRMRALQAGSIQAYLIYIFITLLLLLIFAL